jgi:hypothetical protein
MWAPQQSKARSRVRKSLSVCFSSIWVCLFLQIVQSLSSSKLLIFPFQQPRASRTRMWCRSSRLLYDGRCKPITSIAFRWLESLQNILANLDSFSLPILVKNDATN